MTQQTITLAGTIQKLELRIPNTLGWEEGKPVEVTIRLLSPLV